MNIVLSLICTKCGGQTRYMRLYVLINEHDKQVGAPGIECSNCVPAIDPWYTLTPEEDLALSVEDEQWNDYSEET